MTNDMHRLFSLLFSDKFQPSSYPPFNVLVQQHAKTNHVTYTLEVAVAGFSKEDLAIELDTRILRIRGNAQPREDVQYLHRGIARRAFNLEFAVSPRVVLEGATLDNGILVVQLKREVSQPVSFPIMVTRHEAAALPAVPNEDAAQPLQLT